MRRGTDIRVRSTKAAEALPNGFEPSFVPWREETQGHIPVRRRVPTPPPSGVTESVSELTDHTLYHDNEPTGYAIFRLCYVRSIVNKWNIVLVYFCNMSSESVHMDICFFSSAVLF
jgi:hypothetical protein